MNIKAFNLASRTSETRYISWHETCACKCRLDASLCNDKQCWNGDICKCQCKKLIDKDRCENGVAWNLSTCECESNKSCNVGKFLDYINCRCRERLIDKLVKKYEKDNDGNEIIYDVALHDFGLNKKVCKSCLLYVILLIIACMLKIMSISGTLLCMYKEVIY